jgi:hypothetical protein
VELQMNNVRVLLVLEKLLAAVGVIMVVLFHSLDKSPNKLTHHLNGSLQDL